MVLGAERRAHGAKWLTSSGCRCRFLYAVGGFDGRYLKTVERYDHERDVWEEVPSYSMGCVKSAIL